MPLIVDRPPSHTGEWEAEGSKGGIRYAIRDPNANGGGRNVGAPGRVSSGPSTNSGLTYCAALSGAIFDSETLAFFNAELPQAEPVGAEKPGHQARPQKHAAHGPGP